MNIEGLDYNIQREKLVLPEYGREVQSMVNHAISLSTKAERQQCAETIIEIMERMFPQSHDSEDYRQKLWDHLAIMSEFKLDIDYPVDVSMAKKIATRPNPVEYPMSKIQVRHYGKMMFEIFDKLKTMQPGDERDELIKITANQMKRNLIQWGHGSSDDEKVASDLSHYTDGKIQLNLDKFQFEKTYEKEPAIRNRKKR